MNLLSASILAIAATIGPLRFAVFADLHVTDSASNAAAALRQCIDDANSQDLNFVVVAGDETDFGTDRQETLVHMMLQGLKHPVYAVPGNHDATWSESGSNSFSKIWNGDRFCFSSGGWRFVGCPSGPDVRMSPALVSRESLVWLRSLPVVEKTVFINHYPINDEISNCEELSHIIDSIGTKFCIGGHWHINSINDYNGIPGILCRSCLPVRQTCGIGYTIVTLHDDGCVTASERHLLPEGGEFTEEEPWYSNTLQTSGHCLKPQTSDRPDEDGSCAHPRTVWFKKEQSNIAGSFATSGKLAFYGTTDGKVKCISTKDGKEKWSTQLGGKIFSTPSASGGILVIGCCDGFIYGIKLSSGKVVWKSQADKAVLASPAIYEGIAYIGASDGIFRAIDVKTGATVWCRDGIAGHVICKCSVDSSQVLFGCWGRTLYSLDPGTGKIQWMWTHPSSSPMYSPAACPPVKSHGHIFVAIPDRTVWIFDSATGAPMKRNGEEPYRINGAREALGMSPDGNTVYSKSMHSELISIDAATGVENWRVTTPIGYDIAPSSLSVTSDTVIVPTDKGNIFAFSAKDGSLLWSKHISTALINPVVTYSSGKILASSMDGTIIMLDPHRK